MVWNHRVVRSRNGWYSIREVFYPARGVEPDEFTLAPSAPVADTLDELKETIKLMYRATRHPVIEEADLGKREAGE